MMQQIGLFFDFRSPFGNLGDTMSFGNDRLDFVREEIARPGEAA